jgi:homoserine kinase
MDQPSAKRVRVPASSANLGPGFDTLALALGLYLRCTLRRAKGRSKVLVSGVDIAAIPTDSSNLIFQTFCHEAGSFATEPVSEGFELEIENNIPLGRGLGSSAAAIVAGLSLANEWSGAGRSREQLVQRATEIEGHPDNVAAAILGGLAASCQNEDGKVVSVNCPVAPGIKVVLVVPECRLATEKARAALPDQYSRKDAVFNVQRVALLIEAFRAGRRDLLAEAMRDRLHQPYRAPLVPGLREALSLTGIEGLLGVALSGAGPSVAALCDGNTRKIGEAIADCFRKQGIEAEARSLPVDMEGLVVEKIA